MPSYRKKHIKNKLHKIKLKESVFKKLWFWIVCLILIAIFIGFYFILFYPGFQIKNIVIVGNDKIRIQDLRETALNSYSTDIFNFLNIKVSSKSIFLLNEKNLEKNILGKFPLIGTATVSKIFPETLTLTVEERKPLGVYCGNQSKDEQQCFLIDDKGVVFEEIPLAEASTKYTIVRQVLENEQVFVGEDVIGQNIINVISKIQKNLKDNFQINLQEALIASSMRLNATTRENWKIYFDISGNYGIDSQITKLNLLLNGGISADDKKNLRYIDLRSKDRAIVCDNKVCGEE